MTNFEKFVLRWTIILFCITILIIAIFLKNEMNLFIGLLLGTILSCLKFCLNIQIMGRLIRIKNTFITVLGSILLFIIYLTIFSLVIIHIKVIDGYFILGITIGVSYIPFTIVTENILESLYIIRRKP